MSPRLAQFSTLAQQYTLSPTAAAAAASAAQASNGRRYAPDVGLNQRVAVFTGDITRIPTDAIVNAANSTLLGGGGVDGAIHRAAGPQLLAECRVLNGCDTGDAKITRGHRLPARHVIHTVGPVSQGVEKPQELSSCYRTSLDVAKRNGVRSIAFPCIATGVYGYPNVAAAHVALSTVREWLESNRDHMDLVIFCVFLPVDLRAYTDLAPVYFPPTTA
ncbi:O-acetyl-ADP-ribose deacetylase macrod1 [Polyrhizophydium stewartii]|uniref:O-acetyl-ADP-ribose deacetylase macrod1 n=1 Tax=Polyrhizophydium stewartii TaxID=2732419 RepID=A0ABR4N0C4_9FUNG